MLLRIFGTMAVLTGLVSTSVCRGEELLFEDLFDNGLSPQWKLEGLTKEDYRIRDGGLELRVQSGKPTSKAPRLWVPLTFTTADTAVATVEITPLNAFSAPNEFAQLMLLSDGSPLFSAKKTSVDGFTVFSPGEVDFIGKPGQEGDPGKYTVKYWPADPDAGPVRVIVRDHYAYFQVGPSVEGKYANYFHSAIQQKKEGLGFGLMAGNGPDEGEHWVRFDNFRVVKP